VYSVSAIVCVARFEAITVVDNDHVPVAPHSSAESDPAGRGRANRCSWRNADINAAVAMPGPLVSEFGGDVAFV